MPRLRWARIWCEVGSAEAGRDGGECGGLWHDADRCEEMAAVAEQDADGVEEEGDMGPLGMVLPG